MNIRLRPRTLSSLSVVLLLLSSSPAGAQSPLTKLDSASRTMAQQGGDDTPRVIVRMLPADGGAVRQQLEASERTVVAEHELINAITLSVPGSALLGLANNPLVQTISIDAALQADQTSSSTSNGA